MFEGIINKSHELSRARDKRKADHEVNLQADAVAEYVESKRYSPIRFNIGSAPKGLTDSEFMDRVGSQAMSMLADLGVRGVAYDHDASERSTEEFEALHPNTTPPRGTEGVRVVFDRILSAV